jgi:hypothetical protein
MVLLAGCRLGGIPVEPLEDIYDFSAALSFDTVAAGATANLRFSNREGFPFVYHGCPGLRLERRSGSPTGPVPGWGMDCTPGNLNLPGGTDVLVELTLPATLSAGKYRVNAWISVIDAGSSSPQGWWPSREFVVR